MEQRDLWRPGLDMVVATGAPTTRANKRARQADVVVMTRDNVADFGDRKHPFRTVVLDESSGYKDKGTARWRATNKVVNKSHFTWALTGTPAPNSYMDLWAQIYLLDHGKRLESTLTAYRNRYFDAGRRTKITNIVYEWLLKPGAKDSINKRLEDLCLSMRAEDYLTLPELTFNEVRVKIPPVAKKAYKDLHKVLVADLTLMGGYVHTAANAAVLSNRLRQVCAGFLYEDGNTDNHTWLHDEKMRALQEIVDGTGSPVLVFYQFKEEERKILSVIDGAVSIREPGAIPAWNRGEIRALVAHPQSAGHGLNLQHGGHTIVYTTVPWSGEEWEQSVHRLHRQGQRNAVVVHWLWAGPIDRTAFNTVQDKKSVQDGLKSYLKETDLWL
jgi:SNF2 family DNA or RNA helicase